MRRRRDLQGPAQAEDPAQIFSNRLRGSGCKSHDRRPTVAFEQGAEPQVGGAEVVSPLGSAVRLVESKE